MKLLVIGSGGREHAIAWKLAQSPRVQKVFVAPGNGGTASENGSRMLRSPSCRRSSTSREEKIHLTVVGPEAPLAAGVVDAFRDAGSKIFGPTRAWRSSSLRRISPKASWRGTASRPPRTAPLTRGRQAFVAQRGAPIVVKADGLAAGKAWSWRRALPRHAAIDQMLTQKSFGSAGTGS